KYPTKGDTIQYIYTNSQHNNPLCRVIPIENLQKEVKTTTLDNYDREKYREMVLDAAETVLGSLDLIELFTVISKRKEEKNGMRS
ncbi:MAG: hypothetical protein WBL88_07435, partial [Nitrososphaeraceae archaeon]